jgi:putative peptidoglycan lipid II flippase
MQAHPLLRAGALALVVAVCGVAYFATLFLVGFRFRDFKRHA